MLKISVVIPFHRDFDLLQRAVMSVCNQEIDNIPVSFEIVIGNDSSMACSHISALLLALIPSMHSLIVIDNKYERGPGGNRNSAIDASSGAYLAFLDSDDIWEPKKISFQCELIAEGANFIATGYCFSEEKGVLISPPRRLSGPKSIFYSWSPIGTSTVIVSKAILSPQPFKSLWFCQDLVLWSQLLSNPICRYSSVELPLVQYSKGTGRTSKSSIIELLYYFYKACALSGLTKLESYIATAVYFVRAFKNKVALPMLAKLNSPRPS